MSYIPSEWGIGKCKEGQAEIYALPNRGAFAAVFYDSEGDFEDDEEAYDTACLICAAPDLFAACESALKRIESDIESDNNKTTEGDQLRAALSKAKGEE